MDKDISSILAGWEFEPGKINVRRISGRDGRPKIQLRLDLGVLQMDTEGRPDGQRPHGHESLLHYVRHRLSRHRLAHGSEEGFELDGRTCEQLRAETMMYHHRYLSEFALGDYSAVISDTERNLEALDLCCRHAAEEADRVEMERYRPYIVMMLTRAKAMQALQANDFDGARRAVEDGLESMQAVGDRLDPTQAIADSGEVGVLKALLEEIKRREPVDPITAMEQTLDRAIAEERYEDAARIRDQLGIRRDGQSR